MRLPFPFAAALFPGHHNSSAGRHTAARTPAFRCLPHTPDSSRIPLLRSRREGEGTELASQGAAIGLSWHNEALPSQHQPCANPKLCFFYKNEKCRRVGSSQRSVAQPNQKAAAQQQLRTVARPGLAGSVLVVAVGVLQVQLFVLQGGQAGRWVGGWMEEEKGGQRHDIQALQIQLPWRKRENTNINASLSPHCWLAGRQAPHVGRGPFTPTPPLLPPHLPASSAGWAPAAHRPQRSAPHAPCQ